MTSTGRLPICPACLALFAALAALGAEWRPATGPLMTRWAKDVRADRALPEYPRPQLRRDKWQNLNGLWQLAFAKEGEDAPLGKDLPEQILVPFPVESALSGVMKRAERLWYRRLFTVPKDWAGQHVLLHFGAVDWQAVVWVNGKKLGEHKGGYDGFSLDVTDALKDGGEQEIVVGVWDPTSSSTQPRGKQVNNPSGIYYTPTSGIWQTVWLEPVPAAHIEGVKIVPDVPGRKVTITVKIHGAAAGHSVHLMCLGGQTVLGAGGPVGAPFVLPLSEVKLWSPESPFLYDLRVELKELGKAIDTVDSYFGMRSVGVGPDDKGINRLLLNGKPVFQVGPLDQGFWPDGLYTAPTDEALKYDIEISKKLGFNVTRKHVKVEPDRWYYWCDKLGLLVWQDMPSGDQSVADGKPDLVRTPESARQYELELKRMIDGRYNHPSIILWVVFNEGWGQFDTPRITEWTKRYDPTRLVDCASGWNDHAGVGDVHDIHVYPGPGAPPVEKKRAAVLGEFGGLGLGVDGHTWANKNWSYQGTSSQAELTRKYENLLRRAYKLHDEAGLCAAIYTQITDVETEINGLLTYDRAVVKVDLERAAAANRGDFSRAAEQLELVPTSREKGQPWRFTTDKAAEGWFRPGFDAAGWKEGPGGFGTERTPGAVVRTEWNTSDIWIRREITLPDELPPELYLLMHHDEDAEVYLNGVPAAKVSGYTTGYEEVPISREARAALKPGKNVVAVHCHQTTGGQYIDVGLAAVKPPRKRAD
jgi:hypothetical protein